MALKVWLPLINDFHNRGTDTDAQFTQYGTITHQDAGKIGSCYSVIRTADGDTGSLAYHGFSLPTTGWSMCMWVKFTAFASSTTNSYLICLNKSGASDYQAVLGTYYKSASEAYFTFNLYASGRIVSGINLDTWYHLCITYDGTKGYMYVNGELRNTVNSPSLGTTNAYNLVINGKSSNTAGTDFTGRNNSFYMNDVRVYDECLSPKEIKEIAQGLTIHFKLDRLSQEEDTNIIYDCSGYGNNGFSIFAQQTFSTNTARNSTCNLRSQSVAYMYCRINNNVNYNHGNVWMVQGASAMTVSEWAYATDWSMQTSARLFSCTESGGFNTEGSSTAGYLRVVLHTFSNAAQSSASYTNTQEGFKVSDLSPGWHMFTFTYDQSYGVRTYIDGELHTENPFTSYGVHFNLTGSSLNLGAEANGANAASSPFFVGGLADFRLYYTALSGADIKALYETSASIDNKGDLYAYEFVEDNANAIYKTGVVKNSGFIEDGSAVKNLRESVYWSQYDTTIYEEPDGSKWVRIVHHNNPASSYFSSTDDFSVSVYKSADVWFDAEVCSHVNTWELMVKQKVTSSSSEKKYRWVQQYNPMTATYADVKAAKITTSSDSSYTGFSSGWGGLYRKNTNTYLSQNNGSNSASWWGAIGSWSLYQSGIPGFGTNSSNVITTGYMDLYLRIDNVSLGGWQAKEFIEI